MRALAKNSWASNGRAAVLVLFAFSMIAAGAKGQVCNVPAQRPTVQTAVTDATCALVVLAAGTYSERVSVSRTVTLQGAGQNLSVITGALDVFGTGAVLTVSALTVDTTGARAGCYPEAIRVRDGATTIPDLVAANNAAGTPAGPCPLFADGFESNAVGAWSATAP